MAQVTFIGDPRGEGFESPAACEMFGIIFPLNAPVEVADEAHLAKLKGNSHFEVSESKPRRRKQQADLPVVDDDGQNQE